MPAAKAGPALPPPDDGGYRWQVLIVVMIATLMAALDSSIVNISLPNMMADFGTTIDNIEWVVTGYMLAYSVFIPMAAWFKDRMGARQLFLMALIIFTVSSVLCGLAWNLPSLIGARVLQALGGGFLTPIGMAMITQVFPPQERGRALGLWGMGVIAGPALGPTLGGYLTKHLGWRSIFLVNLPIGVLTVVMGAALLRRDVPPASDRKPFDAWGFFFLALFLVSFLLGLSQGEKEGWTSYFIVSCWVLAALGLSLFLVVESVTPHGIVDLSVFKSRVFTACVLVTSGRTVALFAATFMLPLFVQNLMGRDELQSGLMMMPGALVLALAMPMAGRLSDAMGPRWLALIGAVGLGFFMFQYRLLDADCSAWAIIWPTLIRGIAIALMVAPVMATALNSVPTSQSAQASSVLNLIQQISGSIGIAVLASYLGHRRLYHFADLSQRMQSGGLAAAKLEPLAQQAVALGYRHADAYRLAGAQVMQTVGRAASVRAFDDAFLFGALIVAAACVPVFLLPTRNNAHAHSGSELELDAEAVILE
jgi:EmrB/QacA subfamily drug resistance transporter